MNFTRRSAIYKAVAAVAASGSVDSLTAQELADAGEGQQMFLRLLKSSNESVARMLNENQPAAGRGVGRGANVAALVAAYCAPESTYHKNERLVPLMESASRVFVDAQNPDGTLDAGNLASPPDTGFVVEGLAASLAVLTQTDDPRLARTKDTLTKFLLAAGDALVTGGVHTPNHRWVICSALARIHSLVPLPKV